MSPTPTSRLIQNLYTRRMKYFAMITPHQENQVRPRGQYVVRDRARRAAQTVEQRQACQQSRHDRRNAESTEDRESRLLQLRVNQRERLAAESLEE